MKKTMKILALTLIMGAMLILLTGCGNNKLVATKTTESEYGDYKETVTVTFKDDKVESFEMVMEFEDEETASSMSGIFNLAVSMDESGQLDGMEVEQDGKKLTIKMDAEAYATAEEMSGEELTREKMEESLKEQGYTIK